MLNSNIATQEVETQNQKEKSIAAKTRNYIPQMDVYSDKDALYIEGNMPGVDKTSLDISIENNMLTIVGKNQNLTLDNFTLKYSEYTPGNYRRVFQIHEQIDSEKIEASVKNGLLKIRLPIHQPEVKKIPVMEN